MHYCNELTKAWQTTLIFKLRLGMINIKENLKSSGWE